MSCSPGVQTTAQPTLKPSLGPENDLKPPSAAQTEWSWTTVKGEARTYVRTWDVLHKIMNEFGVSGLSVVLTQGASFYANPETYIFDLGAENPETRKPIDSETVFPAGRLGQPVFGYLVLKLVDRGLFDSDQPLYRYLPKPLPEYPGYADLKGDFRYRSLTARKILTHQSGLTYSRLTRPDRKLIFERSPGGHFRYSEEGYRLLQFVLEQKFGMSINELAKSVVFDFLSLRQMGFSREPSFKGHLAAAAGARDEEADSDSDVSKTFYTSAANYNKFILAVVISGGAFSNPYIGLPYHDPQVPVRTPSIFEQPRSSGRLNLPLGFGWSLGWGMYYIWGYKVKFMGERRQGIECYATVIVGLPGRITAISIFAAGNTQRSVTGRILKELMGEIEPPLAWLGFEGDASKKIY